MKVVRGNDAPVPGPAHPYLHYAPLWVCGWSGASTLRSVWSVGHDRAQAALAEQLAFYRRAAASFDRHKSGALLDEATSRLRGVMDLSGDVLEIACGAGQWSKRLAGSARFLTAIAAAPEMVEFAHRRLTGRLAGRVEIVCADVFDWQPRRRYQAVLFAFWLSHVPPARFEAFWELVATSLAPDGVAAFIDDGPDDAAFEEDLHADSDLPTVTRRLPDPGMESGCIPIRQARWRAGAGGPFDQPDSKYRVVKVLHDPEGLVRSLEELGWAARVEPLLLPSPGRKGVFVGWARRTMTRQ